MPEDRSQELRFFSKKIKKRLAIIPLQVYNKSIERENQDTRQEDKDMNGSRTYTEKREVFGSKDQALDFIAAKKVLLISLREKNGMWCLKYLEA
jgi:hypothetical protein